MNPDVADRVRDESCSLCKLGAAAEKVCVTGAGPSRARVMVVSKNPPWPKYRQELDGWLRGVGLDSDKIYFTQAVKCRVWDLQASTSDVKKCRTYLEDEVKLVRPKFILALGNEALLSLTGHSGISKYRGRPIIKHGATIISTIALGAVKRNPGQRSGFEADLKLFAAQVKGQTAAKVPEPEIAFVKTKTQLRAAIELLKMADVVSYDVETKGENEFCTGDPDPWSTNSAIVTMAFTTKTLTTDGPRIATCFIPLHHPESPFRSAWQMVVRIVARWLRRVPRRVAHNGKYDDRWLTHFGADIHCTFDTILAAHVLDENRPKGLKKLAPALLGVEPWDVDVKTDIYAKSLDELCAYNGRDAYYTYHLYELFRGQLNLRANARLKRLFKVIYMPASDVYRDSERAGVWVDRERLATRWKISRDMRAAIDEDLMEWVPEQELWPRKGRTKRPVEINFNASNFARWLLFDHLELPVLERGKDKDDGSPGMPSMKEAVMLELRSEHPIVPKMLERTKWEKYCNTYCASYDEQADHEDKLHTNYKLHSTTTGRTSSGKVDEEKLVGKVTRRGLNLQQVPRDPFIRGILGAPPGYLWVSADFSQIELRIVAFLSRDRRMMDAYINGEDIHLITASNVLGIPMSQITKDQRKKAKAVNFGFVYGMSWRKFIQTAFEKYDLAVSASEAQSVRKAYFELYSGLRPWHAQQRRLVNKYGRVQSPLGRVRHLPDIYSPDDSVRHEAERQAINAPVQSLGSDMTLLSMILADKRLKRAGVRGHSIGTVHDELNFQILEQDVPQALPIIKDTMENLPMERLFNVDLDVPIKADIEVGRHWGDCIELKEDQVRDFHTSMIEAAA